MLTHDMRNSSKDGSSNIANSLSRMVQYGESIPLQSNCTAQMDDVVSKKIKLSGRCLKAEPIALYYSRRTRCLKGKQSPFGPPVMAWENKLSTRPTVLFHSGSDSKLQVPQFGLSKASTRSLLAPVRMSTIAGKLCREVLCTSARG
jgi:hypothetical protein